MDADIYNFESLPSEIRTEVLFHCDIQSLGRYIQINKGAERYITKIIWKKQIEGLDLDIWNRLSKRTRKGDLILLCAIIKCGLESCQCVSSYSFPCDWRDLLLHLDTAFPVPAQNALLCYLLTYAKHGSVSPKYLSKRMGMQSGHVFLSHGRLLPWFEQQDRSPFTNFGFKYRVFFHQFARVTFSWSVKWKMDPLFINNQELFLHIKLYDKDDSPIEFEPIMKQRINKNKRPQSSAFKIQPQKKKFYTVPQIIQNAFKCVLDGVEISPYDLYHFFDYACLWDRWTCPRSAGLPKVVQTWLLTKSGRPIHAIKNGVPAAVIN